MERAEGEYWLIYKDSRSPKKRFLGIKFPSMKSRFYLRLGGNRATELYKYIILTLDSNRVEYSLEKIKNRVFLKLPWSTGLAITIFLLTVYSNRKPLTHAPILAKMLNGEMPLMTHLTRLIQLAIDLTDYATDAQRDRLVSHKSASTVSKMINELLKLIQGNL